MRKLIFLFSQFAAIALLVLFQSYPISAQAKDDCSESNLRSKRVSMLSCSDESDSCSTDPNIVNSGNSNSTIQAFARSPLNSNWAISDATVEQWFLKQAGASRVKNRYGLNESNINEITAVVKVAGVSPVFFYTYTVNEGGGAGGFINHYGHEAPGGGVGNATKDANYLRDASQNMASKPSWFDAGNVVHFVPQGVQDAGNKDFQNMPIDTIGRAYIPATAATTWEVYYPDGLKKEFNQVQNYGSPLNDMINNIKEMGGDPAQGGVVASGDCQDNNKLSGEGVTKAVEWAKMIANNNGYGYDQSTRTSGWQKWQEDPNCTDQCGSFDCSSFIAGAFTEAGIFKTNPQFNTGSMVDFLSKNGFKKVADSEAVIENLQPGDILIRTGHTALYIGGDQIAHASINENRGSTGGQVGDQTGKEIAIASFSKTGWDLGIWRASN